MCMGYAKEIRAWVCDEAGSQREVMMDAWSRAFEDSEDATELSVSFLPPDSAVTAYGIQHQHIVFSPRTVGTK